MTTTLTTADWLTERLRAADWTSITSRYAANVVLDVNVPKWRMQLQGRDAVAQAVAEDLQKLKNVRTPWVRTTSNADTVVLEYELRWDGIGGEWMSRAVCLFRLAGGSIVKHTEYCCGGWDPQDLAKNLAEAPIITW
jgi:predicted SnoaL-like aldol condensation-catalyzing enzyme